MVISGVENWVLHKAGFYTVYKILVEVHTDERIEFTTTAVYAVYRVAPQFDNDPAYPAGVYAAIFAVSHPGFSFINVRLNEQGQMVRLDYLIQTPKEVLEREATEILLAPSG